MSGSPSLVEPAEFRNAPKRKASPSPDADDHAFGKRPRRESGSSPERYGHHHRRPSQQERPPSPGEARYGAGPRPAAEPERRKSVTKEEKKRGMRLFGGLLSTLSQTAPSNQQRRRQEIEKRQLEKARQQKLEDDQRREEKLARIVEGRRGEQIHFEERVMKTRHARMRATAGALRTRADPLIYYRPSKLTSDQEDIINDQRREIESKIRDEVEAFGHRRDEHRRRHGGGLANNGEAPARAESYADDESARIQPLASASEPSAMAEDTDTASASEAPGVETSESAPLTAGPRPLTTEIIQPDEVDEVVEADEDMVIY